MPQILDSVDDRYSENSEYSEDEPTFQNHYNINGNGIEHINAINGNCETRQRQNSDPVEVEAEIRKSKCSSGLEIIKNVTIEPLMFLQMTSYTGSAIVISNLYIDRICRIDLGHSEEICDNLKNNSEIETEVDALATNYSLYKMLIEGILPIFFSLCIGPWSDRNGTKIPMLTPILGYIISAILYLLFSLIWTNAPTSLVLISSIPNAFSGGLISFILSAFTFIAAKSTVETRSLRIAIVEGVWFLGMPFGLLGGAKLYSVKGFATVFIISVLLNTLAFFYGLFFIHDEKKSEIPSSTEGKNWILNDVKESFITLFRKREGRRRMWIFILLGALCLRIFTLFGAMQIDYLFTRNKFKWDITEYSVFQTYNSFMSSVGTLILIWVGMKLLKMSDIKIGLVSSFCYVIYPILFAFANEPWMIYLGASIGMFAGLITIVTRSLISKLVAKNELGKIFSIVACAESSSPILSGPLYNFIFKKTVSDFIGTVYLVSAFFNVLIFITFLYFLCNQSSDLESSEIAEDEED